MKFKRFRYNLIVSGLVAIMGCCIAIPVISGGKSDTNQGTTITDPEIVEEDINNDITDFEENNEEDYEEETSIFEDMSSVELINYAIDKLYNGKGYYSTYKQEAYNVTTAFGASITVPQRAVGTIIRSGRNSLQENYFYSEYNQIKADELKRFYQYYYVDRDNNTFIEGITSSYDYKNMTYDMTSGSKQTMSYDEFVERYCMLYGDSFPITTNPKKGDVIYSDKIDGNYRTIEVNYNVNNLPKCVKDLYGITGQLKNINYQSLKYTYKINLKNGKMVSAKRVEKIAAVAAGFPSEMTTTTTQFFKSVDEEQTIIEPGL